jgi:hypothetical protein
MELFSLEAAPSVAAPLASCARRNTALHKSAIIRQTARSSVTVDSFIDLAELSGC